MLFVNATLVLSINDTVDAQQLPRDDPGFAVRRSVMMLWCGPTRTTSGTSAHTILSTSERLRKIIY